MKIVHTAESVLRASTAKVQRRYRGKYPNRVASVSYIRESKMMVLTSNAHRVLEFTYAEGRAMDDVAAQTMAWMNRDIMRLAQDVADYRNHNPHRDAWQAFQAHKVAVSPTRAAMGAIARFVANDIDWTLDGEAHNPLAVETQGFERMSSDRMLQRRESSYGKMINDIAMRANESGMGTTPRINAERKRAELIYAMRDADSAVVPPRQKAADWSHAWGMNDKAQLTCRQCGKRLRDMSAREFCGAADYSHLATVAREGETPAFVGFHSPEGRMELCEGGVHTQPRTAAAEVAELNARYPSATAERYFVASSLVQFERIEATVESSLTPRQLAMVAAAGGILASAVRHDRWHITINGRPLCDWTACQAGRDDAREACKARAAGVTSSADCCSFTSYNEALAVLASWQAIGKRAAIVAGECPIITAMEAEESGVAARDAGEYTGPYSVAVVLADRAYGGSEEGGWYYDCGTVAGEHADKLRGFTNEADAIAYARELNESPFMAELNEGRRAISSVLSEGRYHARVFDGMPADYPATRPHYE